MGKLMQNHDDILDFTVNQIQEPSGIFVLHVEITISTYSVTYRICDDDNHPSISQIETDFINGLTAAKSSNVNFLINEFKARQYLRVTFPNGNTVQYTGHKIKER